MKLVKSKVLYFQEGNSDKVYEVDLCEVEGDLFIVNFRYGRRGADLREGTKTVFPVGIEEAESVFNKLVLSKEKKGYHEAGQAPAVAAATPPKAKVNTGRKETILKYLNAAVAGTYNRNWKVSRIIWRAGDLGIAEAAENISSFLNSKDDFERYAAVNALAKLNNANYLDQVLDILNEKGSDDKLGRVAVAHLLKLSAKNSSYQQEIFRRIFLELPSNVRQGLEHKQGAYASLAVHFMGDLKLPPKTLYYLYLLTRQDANLIEPLKEIIHRVPLKANVFQSIRYIFRSAEIMEDADFYTLIAKRIAVSHSNYNGTYFNVNGNWIKAKEELKKKDSKIAFSIRTKNYFNRTAYRHIYTLGQSDQDGFVEFAKALLCNLDDQLDNAKVEMLSRYSYNLESRRYDQKLQIFPKYAGFSALLYILYGRSEQLKRGKSRWYYLSQAPDVKTQGRQEIFPELWNSRAEDVLHILAHSRAELATSFALRIVDDNPAFLDQIPDSLIQKLLSHSDARVVEKVIGVLEKKYENSQPGSELLLQVLAAKSERAVELGSKWLVQYEANYFQQEGFTAKLVLIENLVLNDYLKSIYESRVAYTTPIQFEQFNPFYANRDNYSIEFLSAVNELISKTHFGQLLNDFSVEKIKSLAASSISTDKLFAANFSKVNGQPTFEIIKDHIESYLNADEQILRKVGVELLADFPDAYLVERYQLIGEYCFSPHEEVRLAIQPTVGRLINLNKDFKAGLLQKLLTILTEAEEYPGVHESSYELLKQYYGENLEELSQEDIINLSLSKYAFTQKLGYQLFQSRVDISKLDMPTLVSLTHSDVKELRKDLHNYLEANPDRANFEFFESLKIFNTTWEETRRWAFDFFGQHIKTENWTLETLLYVCDHTNAEVQGFGRKMVTTHFKKEEGLKLMLKLQEHPAKTMQFFTTNYLETYAIDNAEVILQLELFFKTTLFNINQNRAAKTRVFKFLEQEAVKSPEVGEMTIRILNSILSTNTLVDKSSCIDILLALKETFPHLEVPLTIKAV